MRRPLAAALELPFFFPLCLGTNHMYQKDHICLFMLNGMGWDDGLRKFHLVIRWDLDWGLGHLARLAIKPTDRLVFLNGMEGLGMRYLSASASAIVTVIALEFACFCRTRSLALIYPLSCLWCFLLYVWRCGGGSGWI